MAELTLSWVSELSEPDQRGNRYVNVAFEEWNDTAYAGKKDLDTAMELHGLLKEKVGVLQNFQLEDSGKKNKKGATRWKILGFGTPGGAATYTAPGSVQGGVLAGAGTVSPAGPSTRRSPEHDVEASIRAAVALKAAVQYATAYTCPGPAPWIEFADAFYDWLSSKTSEPALSEYEQPVEAEPPQAGAGSEQSSPSAASATGSDGLRDQGSASAVGGDSSSAGGFSGPPFQSPADSAGLVDSGDGEAPESTPHIHDWYQAGPRNWLKCDCGQTRKKEVVT